MYNQLFVVIISLVTLMCLSVVSPVQAEGQLPTIARYRGDRQGAFSFTFDDGFRQQVENTVEILDQFDFKGTFFVIPMYNDNPERKNNVVTWDRMKELIADGQEIGTHGSISEKLHEAEPERLDYLINHSFELIVENAGYRPVSYALPGGSKATDEVVEVISKNHFFVRNKKLLPNAKTQGYGNTDRRTWDDHKTRKQILSHVEQGGWYIPIVHAIVKGWSPFKSKDEFRGHCAWLKTQEDKIWVAPMGVVGRYVFARDHSQIKVVEQSSNLIRFSVSCSLQPAEVFAVEPLTIIIPAADAMDVEAIDVNGDALETVVRGGKVLVEVVPDGGEVVVSW